MAGNGYGNDRGGHVYDDEDDDDGYNAHQHGHGGRNFASRAYNSYDRRYDNTNNAYQSARYDVGASSPRGLGGPHDRGGVYAPPTATTINNNRGVGSSQYPSRRGGPPGATRYPNPSTAYDNFSYPPSRPAAPSPRQPQGFGGVAGQLLNAAGQLSPSNKRASEGHAVFDDEMTIGPAAGGEKSAAARLKSASASGGSAAASRSFGLYAPSGGGSGEIPRGAASSRGDHGDGGGEARFRDRGRSQAARAPASPRYQERTWNSFEERDQQQQHQDHQQKRQRKASPPPTSARAPATAAVDTAQERHSGARTPSASAGGGKRSRSRSRSRSSSPRPPAAPADPPPPPPPNQAPSAGAGQTMTASAPAAATRSTAAASTAASSSAAAAAAARPAAAPSRPPLSWVTIERAGKRRLGGPAEERRSKLGGENETVSPFQGCPIHDCPMGASDGISVSWMARHLESHTKVAMEKPQKELYIRSTVAEVLHDMCLDSEVPRAHRKFERRKMSRALLDTPRAGIGHLAGIMETVATGDNKSPHVRRCAHDLAVGGCEGITREGTIVRCDKCKAWYHISCGQMVRGDGISSDEAREETLCRTCARLTIGAPQGKDHTATLQKQLTLVREKRTKMLDFLEGDVETGAPCGVFDLPLNIRDVSTAGGVGPKDGTANRPAAGGNGNGGNGGVDKRNNSSRPPCAAASCGRESRQDSKFCCDGCGVLHAEAFLAKAIRHHVEESAGIDRGRRLRETRELKTRKQQIGLAMKKVEFPRVPGFKTERETALHGLVVRRCRLWQRLIEIGAYWEKVSGSRGGLLTSTKTAAQTSSRQATAAAAAAAAAAVASAAAASGVADTSLRRSAPERQTGGRDRGGSVASASSRGGGQVELDVGGDNIAAVAKKNTAAACAGQQEAEGSGAGKEVVGVATAEAAAAAAEGQGAPNGCVGGEGGGTKKRAREDGDGPPQQASKSLKQTSNGGAASGIAVGGGSAATPETPSVAAVGGQGKGKGKAVLDPRAAESPTTTAMEVSSAAPEAEVDVGLEGPETMAQIVGQAWMYGAVGNQQVAWYCPPGGREADRFGNSEQLQAYLRERYGNGRVPGQFTFRCKDAPPHWERVDARRPDNGSLIAKDTASAPPPSGGVQNFTCVYCGEETGPRVSEHLERCYRKATAMRNERLKHATLRPLPENHFLQGGSRLGASSVTEPVSVPPSAALDSPAAIGRQLLSRRIAYANLDSLPDPSRFQLHHDLKGWWKSPSRLDFLYKELVRQRNAAIYELQALDREEAELEVHLRRDWMKDDLRSIPRMRINYL